MRTQSVQHRSNCSILAANPRLRCYSTKKKSVRCEISSRASSGCDGTTNFCGANDYRSNRSDELSDLPYSICGDLTSCLLMLVCRDEHLMWGLFLMCAVVQRMPSFLVINFLTQSPPEQGFLLSCAATSISNPRTGIALFASFLTHSKVSRWSFSSLLYLLAWFFSRRLLIGPAA